MVIITLAPLISPAASQAVALLLAACFPPPRCHTAHPGWNGDSDGSPLSGWRAGGRCGIFHFPHRIRPPTLLLLGRRREGGMVSCLLLLLLRALPHSPLRGTDRPCSFEGVIGITGTQLWSARHQSGLTALCSSYVLPCDVGGARSRLLRHSRHSQRP